ncbi:hypothetical protein MMC12_000886 [Toensbergia leucococca]|nr:hypothetical protein [Toensbergia leucococca]
MPCITVSLWIYLSLALNVLPSHATYWSGFHNVKYMFNFGDSYTATGFSYQGTQPNPNNPLGNPAYPGTTSSNGPNYVDYLTTTYNKSYIQTYNLGYPGATIDPALVGSPYGYIVQSFRQQVEDEWTPTYSQKTAPAWTASNTLFTSFFGINDIQISYSEQNKTLDEDLRQSYLSYIELLYAAGGRNFLILNVPPIDRSPGTLENGPASAQEEANIIGDFNVRLNWVANDLRNKYSDITVFVFDTNWLFTLVIDNPQSFALTAGYRNVTGFCAAYQSGTPAENTYTPSCGIPVDEYLWLNNIHPTSPIHELMASQIVSQIG